MLHAFGFRCSSKTCYSMDLLSRNTASLGFSRRGFTFILCVSIALLAGAAQAAQDSIRGTTDFPEYDSNGAAVPQRTRAHAAEWAANGPLGAITKRHNGRVPGLGRKRALIVSMSYRGTDDHLVDAESTQTLMQNFVKDTLQFQDGNIKCVNDFTSDVTVHVMEQEVAWLKKDVQAGDVLFFYVHCHGMGPDDYYLKLSRNEKLRNIKATLSNDVPKGVTIVVVLCCCRAGGMMQLRHELDSQRGSFRRAASQQPETLENGPAIVVFTACRGNQTGKLTVSQVDGLSTHPLGLDPTRADYFTEAFVKEMVRKDGLEKKKDRHLLNSFRAMKHNVANHRFKLEVYLMNIGDLVEARPRLMKGRTESAYGKWSPAQIVAKYKRRNKHSKKEEQFYDVRFLENDKVDAAIGPMEVENCLRPLQRVNSEADIAKCWEEFKSGANWLDLHVSPQTSPWDAKRKIDTFGQGIDIQTPCCESNSSRLDLRKLAFRDLVDGICDANGIKEKYLRSEASLSAVERQAVLESKQRQTVRIRHLLKNIDSMPRTELEVSARFHQILLCFTCNGKGTLGDVSAVIRTLKEQESHAATGNLNKIILNLEGEIRQLEFEQASLPKINVEKLKEKLIRDRDARIAKNKTLEQDKPHMYKVKMHSNTITIRNIEEKLKTRSYLTKKNYKHVVIQKSIDRVRQRIAEFAELRCDACDGTGGLHCDDDTLRAQLRLVLQEKLQELSASRRRLVHGVRTPRVLAALLEEIETY